MAIDKEVFDEILLLTAQVMLTELRAAVAAGASVDPRKIKNALDLVERSDARAFQAKEPDVIINTATAASEDAPLTVKATTLSSVYKTKEMRDKLRKLPTKYLTPTDCAILNSFAEADGAEVVTQEYRKDADDELPETRQ